MKAPSRERECAYCRKTVRTPIAMLETRPGTLIRLDGSKVPRKLELLVCLPCDKRLTPTP